MTLVAVVVVAATLAAGSIALVVALRNSLTDQIQASAELRAMDVADIVARSPAIPPLIVEDPEDNVIQLLDETGRVVASSDNIAGAPPLSQLRPGETDRVKIEELPDDDTILIVAAEAARPGQRLTVLVGREVDSVVEVTGIVGGLLGIGLPALVALVGLIVWRGAGAALRPVEAMRAEVEEISAAELYRRVPEPATDDEVARLAETMNSMLDRLQRSHDRQIRFVSDASHELRSPVATLRQHAEVALAHPERVDPHELAETVQGEAQRLQDLVDDLFVLARADETSLDLDRREVDLDDLVFAEAARARRSGAVMVDTIGVSAGRVLGDGAMLGRVVRNLVDNAVRHADRRVALTLETIGAEVVLHVDDDGVGIPDHDRRRVFERFVRLDEARARSQGGAGLGLAIVSHVVAAHGGTVAAASSPLGGARFTVRVPRATDGPG